MTQIDFYLLAARENPASFACRLTEKAYRQGHRVYLLTDSAAEARSLDELLWTFRQGSFVPHAVFTEETETDAAVHPVGIGWGPVPVVAFGDVLVNLSSKVPEEFERFQRVIELVAAEESARELSRERFRCYRQRGFDPRKVAVAASA
jgi:DNA polymerase IIIc chi subunit